MKTKEKLNTMKKKIIIIAAASFLLLGIIVVSFLFFRSEKSNITEDHERENIESRSEYNSEYISRHTSGFFKGCVSGGLTSELCSCLMDFIKKNVSPNDFIAEIDRFDAEKKFSDKFLKVVEEGKTNCSGNSVVAELQVKSKGCEDIMSGITSENVRLLLHETLSYSDEAINCYKQGNNKQDLKDYSGAMEYFTKAIELDHKFALAYTSRGVIKTTSGDYTSALEDLNKGTALAPEAILGVPTTKSKLAEAYYAIGAIKNKLGDKKGALEAFNKAGELGISRAYEDIRTIQGQ